MIAALRTVLAQWVAPWVAAITSFGKAAIITLLLSALFLMETSPYRTHDLTTDNAIGCDPFGYMRGGELIRDKGLFAGLDTSIETADSGFLIAAGRATGMPPSFWSEAIAPLCHHYDAHSEKVILQYPPGTALLMSLLPRGRADGSMMIAIGLVAMSVLALCLETGASFLRIVVLFLLTLGTARLLASQAMHASFSIPWSIALIPGIAFAGLRLPGLAGIRQVAVAAALGGGCGLLVLVRLPNVLLVAGIGLFLVLAMRLWTTGSFRRHGRALLSGATLFVLTGPAFLGLSNWINTGGPLKTTYPGYDASGPVLSWVVAHKNIDYYFDKGEFSTLLISCLSVSLLAFVIVRRAKKYEYVYNAVLCSLFVNVISVIFFVTHAVVAAYYFLPSIVFTIFFLVFACCRRSERTDETIPRWLRRAALIGFACLIVSQVPRTPARPDFSAQIPAEVLAPDAVVWANFTSGTLLYYNGKYTGKLHWAENCTMQRLIKYAWKNGKRQYFIDDSEPMHNVIKALSGYAKLSVVGTYDVYQKFEVVRLDDLMLPEDCFVWL